MVHLNKRDAYCHNYMLILFFLFIPPCPCLPHDYDHQFKSRYENTTVLKTFNNKLNTKNYLPFNKAKINNNIIISSNDINYSTNPSVRNTIITRNSSVEVPVPGDRDRTSESEKREILKNKKNILYNLFGVTSQYTKANFKKHSAPYSDVNFENLQNYFQNDQNLKPNSSVEGGVEAGDLGKQQQLQQQGHLGQQAAAGGSGSAECVTNYGLNSQNKGQKRRSTTILPKTTKRHTGRPSKRTTTTTRKPRPSKSTKAPVTRPSPKTTKLVTITTITTTTTKKMDETTPSSGDGITADDATWILICGFIIFTMQTGFGLLEGGIVSQKNETNIMMKNVADVVLGGFTYWIFGYGITYGTWKGSSPVFGIGYYAVDAYSREEMGDLFTSFFFQLSFATTATTIVSGAVAERCNFKAYCMYSFWATITYSVQARWVWGPTGFLGELGAVDIAGSGSVHLVGGSAALVAAWMLGPRMGRYDKIGGKTPGPPPMGNPTSALVGLFFLWWGWFAFNAGSTYGVTEDKWKYAARAAATTIVASIGGGLVGLIWGWIKPGQGGGRIFDPTDMINTVLGALVGVTAGCAIFHTPEAFAVGVIGAVIVIIAGYFPDSLKIDDPVGAVAVHGFGGLWGLIAVGIFAEDDAGVLGVTKGRYGLIRGGGWELIGVQGLTALCIIVWSLVTTFILLWIINLIVPLRVSPHEELLGLDFCEHGIRRSKIGTSPAISLFGSYPEICEIRHNLAGITGKDNPAHERITETLRDVRFQKPRRRRPSYHQDPKKSADLKQRKLKSAALFARAFYKLQSKGNRITPRERQYVFDEYTSPLRSSSDESVNSRKGLRGGGGNFKSKRKQFKQDKLPENEPQSQFQFQQPPIPIMPLDEANKKPMQNLNNNNDSIQFTGQDIPIQAQQADTKYKPRNYEINKQLVHTMDNTTKVEDAKKNLDPNFQYTTNQYFLN